ncbi:MAG: hypothetical protein BBJ57_00015 [Desulfobacterales bacterium PC51MH44]|nr:MAG: hypothetical protein BBJ57_00015 [Desulfobacterales bacterium PC51MH44]
MVLPSAGLVLVNRKLLLPCFSFNSRKLQVSYRISERAFYRYLIMVIVKSSNSYLQRIVKPSSVKGNSTFWLCKKVMIMCMILNFSGW